MSMTFDVSKLKVDLERVRLHMTTKAARKAVIAGAEVIGAAMIEHTPEQVEKRAGSNSLEPGAVKANIRVRSKTSAEGHPYALVGPDKETAHVAHWVEYGHRMVSGGQSKIGEDGKVRGPGKVHEEDVPAYPFLRPAYEESASEAADVVAETLREELKEAVKA